MVAGVRGVVAAVAASLLLAACTSQLPPRATGPLPPAETAYRLAVGDKLRVNVFGEANVSGEFQVAMDGNVAMPLIGNVKVAGLGLREVEQTLTERYAAGYINQPKITVDLLDIRPYFMLGEIQKPGRYPMADGLDVLGAIATAGGYTYRANQRKVFIRRAGQAGEYEVDMTENPIVAPGDVIRVGERYF